MAFGGFHSQSNTTPVSDVNVTPLVDVILVLLIIFMITAPLLTHAVKIDLPQGSSAPHVEKPQSATLSINATGQFFWNDVPVERAALITKLTEWGQKPAQNEVHLRADKATRYEVIADVMSLSRQAGVQKIGFVTLPNGHE